MQFSFLLNIAFNFKTWTLTLGIVAGLEKPETVFCVRQGFVNLVSLSEQVGRSRIRQINMFFDETKDFRNRYNRWPEALLLAELLNRRIIRRLE